MHAIITIQDIIEGVVGEEGRRTETLDLCLGYARWLITNFRAEERRKVLYIAKHIKHHVACQIIIQLAPGKTSIPGIQTHA